MAGRKKKKPSANPARGFATVSLPSKAKETAGSDDDTKPSRSQRSPADRSANSTGSVEHPELEINAEIQKPIADMTAEELEEHLEVSEMRNLIEQHASRVKSEALRQAVKLKNERRQLRQQADQASVYGLSNPLIDSILRDSLQTQAARLQGTSVNYPSELEESELLQKLWLLQEVLRHLKVKMVDEILSHVLSVYHNCGFEASPTSVWGLQEALHWIAGSDSADEDLPYDSAQNSKTIESIKASPNGDISDKIEDLSPENNGRPLQDDLSARPIENALHSDMELTSSDGDDDDPENLVDHWLKLRSRLFVREQDVETLNHKLPRPGQRRLIDRIKAIERDVLFDTVLAQQRWQIALRDLEIEAGKVRKRATKAVNDKNEDHWAEEDSTLVEGDESPMLSNIFGDENAGEQRALTPEHAETVVYHDFGTWSGPGPQKLLEEACTDLVSRDGLSFRQCQTSSYSSRSDLQMNFEYPAEIDAISVDCIPRGIILEQRSRSLVLKMDTTATKNIQQSNAYLATIALFLLTSADIINNKNSSRLPKVWKDLLSELLETRHELQMKDDVRQLQHIRLIIRMMTKPSETVQTTVHRKGNLGERGFESQKSGNISVDTPDQARSKWLDRAASTAYVSMQPARQSLPVHAFKNEILEAFERNPIVIVCADTGAGKSTQIPSYVLEQQLSSGHDYRIIVTQPRRISAISIARRVSREIGESNNALGTVQSLVGYAIRMESKVSRNTRLNFVTTGVLLRMLQESPDLDHIDCLILDEVHERTMDLDLLFIALKRLRKRRQSLKIVLMSATVDATKFSAYFDNAPVLSIPGRTFPVQVGFLEDAIEASLCITDNGQAVNSVEEEEYGGDDDELDQVNNGSSTGLEKYSPATQRALAQYEHTRLNYNTILRLAIAIATGPEFVKYSKAILIFMPGLSEIRRLNNLILSTKTFSEGWVIHMLHSSFSTQDLEKAFLLPPKGHRKIVIATNIAETGITIPDVTAVIDTCKEKIMRFDERRQVSRLTEGYIARASARQRKGRAARVQDGLCFHLVTRQHFENKLQEQSTPEMLRLSLQEPILRIKVWKLGPAEDTLSEALDPPSMKNVRRALAKLQDVGALDSSERLTALGKALVKLPLDVAMGKMAILGVLFQSLDAILTIIASFATKSIFANDNSSTSFKEFARGDSDLLTVYNAYSGWKKACQQGTAQQFSQKYHLSQFSLRQLEEQKVQSCVYLVEAGLVSFTPDEYVNLQSARNNRPYQNTFDVPARYNRLSSDSTINAIIAMALYPKLLKREGNGYRNVYSNQQIQIAPTSINRLTPKSPEWICYLEATQARNGRLNAFHCSKVSQATLCLLLGQADFKYFAGVVDIDHGRVRLSLRRWKETLALHNLRIQIDRVLLAFLARPEAPISPDDQAWLETLVTVLDGSSLAGVHLQERLLHPPEA